MHRLRAAALPHDASGSNAAHPDSAS